jgi:endonuclease G
VGVPHPPEARVDRKTAQTVVIVAALLAVAAVIYYLSNRPATDEADESIHLALGNPSGATTDPANANNFLMRKPYFALSYNNGNGTPNWVSWRLVREDLGSAARGQFFPDDELPHGFLRVTPNDYTGTGFDRGHMCPRSDRSATSESANATFVMTNIVPQAPHLNQKAWNDLEDYCRTLVRTKRQTLYIAAGPQGRGGEGSKGRAETIRRGVVVPEKCWKVIAALDDGGRDDDAARVTSSTRVIAVVMPNEQSVGHGWAKYRVSVKEVETLTGYTFFDRVPKDVAGPLKEKVDDQHIPPPRPPRTGD